jgi:hypothetical protein
MWLIRPYISGLPKILSLHYFVTFDEPFCRTVAQPLVPLKIAVIEMTNPPERDGLTPHERRGAWLIPIREVSPKDRKVCPKPRGAAPMLTMMQPFKPQSVQKDTEYNQSM